MGIGRIASFLSSLSPASDAAAVSAPDEVSSDSARLTENAAGTNDRRREQRNDESGEVTHQLQTMIAAVKQLNDNAVQQGAAIAVSSAGAQLKNAVTGLGHILANIDAQTLSAGIAGHIRDANDVVDAVESGIVGTQAATEQLLRNLPAQQAQYAQEVSARFQTDMRDALNTVRGSLAAFQR